jgi:DNA-binding LytR/AlgR family response regulator
MVKQTVLIADKDGSFRQDLRKKILGLEYPAIFHETCNGPEAIRYIDGLQPAVVFINASLPGLPGFEVLKRIQHVPMAVVISDNPEDALKAIDVGAAGYLMKPICPENLKRTLIRISTSEMMQAGPLGKMVSYPNRIFLEKEGKLKNVRVSDIIYLRAHRDYTWIYTREKTAYLSNHGIGLLRQRLNPDTFLRVHRSYIVNLDYVQELCKDVRRFYLLMEGQVEIGIGKQYVPIIRNLIF